MPLRMLLPPYMYLLHDDVCAAVTKPLAGLCMHVQL